MTFDGYEIVREIHASSRSHIYLAIDIADGATGRAEDAVDRSARRPGLLAAIS